MARKPAQIDVTPVEVPDVVTENAAAIVRAADAADLMVTENTKALAAQLGYSGSLNPVALEDGIAESKAMINQGLFTLGARLLLLKEQCAHGEFMAVLERQGVGYEVAKKTMQATLKFANRSTSTDFAKLGKSKLFELAVLDDEEIKELTDGGSARGITLDEVDRMSVSELRRALRDAREEREATSRLLSDKNSKIDELATKLAARQSAVKAMPPADIADQLRRELLERAGAAEVTVLALRQYLAALRDHGEEHGLDHTPLMSGALAQVRFALDGLADQFDLRIEPLAERTPAWLKGQSAGESPRDPNTVDWVGQE
ncbi:MAG: hypothetical protein AB1713_10315 [Pseudomonadota bacterium]